MSAATAPPSAAAVTLAFARRVGKSGRRRNTQGHKDLQTLSLPHLPTRRGVPTTSKRLRGSTAEKQSTNAESHLEANAAVLAVTTTGSALGPADRCRAPRPRTEEGRRARLAEGGPGIPVLQRH